MWTEEKTRIESEKASVNINIACLIDYFGATESIKELVCEIDGIDVDYTYTGTETKEFEFGSYYNTDFDGYAEISKKELDWFNEATGLHATSQMFDMFFNIELGFNNK